MEVVHFETHIHIHGHNHRTVQTLKLPLHFISRRPTFPHFQTTSKRTSKRYLYYTNPPRHNRPPKNADTSPTLGTQIWNSERNKRKRKRRTPKSMHRPPTMMKQNPKYEDLTLTLIAGKPEHRFQMCPSRKNAKTPREMLIISVFV